MLITNYPLSIITTCLCISTHTCTQYQCGCCDLAMDRGRQSRMNAQSESEIRAFLQEDYLDLVDSITEGQQFCYDSLLESHPINIRGFNECTKIVNTAKIVSAQVKRIVSSYHHPLPLTPLTITHTTHYHSPPLTTTHHHSPPLTTTHHHSLLFTTTHHHSPPLTTTHHHSLLFTTTHHHSLLFTTTQYHSIPLNTTHYTTHYHSLPLTTTHHHSPPLNTTQYHSPPFTITHHHSPPFTTTHYQPPQLTITHLITPPQINGLHCGDNCGDSVCDTLSEMSTITSLTNLAHRIARTACLFNFSLFAYKECIQDTSTGCIQHRSTRLIDTSEVYMSYKKNDFDPSSGCTDCSKI